MKKLFFFLIPFFCFSQDLSDFSYKKKYTNKGEWYINTSLFSFFQGDINGVTIPGPDWALHPDKSYVDHTVIPSNIGLSWSREVYGKFRLNLGFDWFYYTVTNSNARNFTMHWPGWESVSSGDAIQPDELGYPFSESGYGRYWKITSGIGFPLYISKYSTTTLNLDAHFYSPPALFKVKINGNKDNVNQESAFGLDLNLKTNFGLVWCPNITFGFRLINPELSSNLVYAGDSSNDYSSQGDSPNNPFTLNEAFVPLSEYYVNLSIPIIGWSMTPNLNMEDVGSWIANVNDEVQRTDCVQGNCKNGKGTYIYNPGLKYDGNWENAKKHYVGNFKKSLPNGKGTMAYHDGSYYEGGFKDGKREGEGVHYIPEINTKYTGQWMNDMMNGRCSIDNINTFSTYRFEGNCLNGKREGKGVEVYKDGSSYDGEWVSDQREGFGVFIDSDGSTYSGNWFNNKKHGKGTLSNSEGKREGTWSFDKIIKLDKKPELIVSNIKFSDSDGDLFAGEQGSITFDVQNIGDFAAFDLVVSCVIEEGVAGLQPGNNPGVIKKIDINEKRTLTIPFLANENIESGTVVINVTSKTKYYFSFPSFDFSFTTSSQQSRLFD